MLRSFSPDIWPRVDNELGICVPNSLNLLSKFKIYWKLIRVYLLVFIRELTSLLKSTLTLETLIHTDFYWQIRGQPKF